MRKYVSSLFLMVILLLFSGCDFNEWMGNDSSRLVENDTVTSVEDLDDTEYFLPSALEHILKGEINRNGQAVGFHYEGFPGTNGKVIEDTESDTDKHDVYEAKVMINDIEKESNQGKSTFFPENWPAQAVIDAINDAYDNRSYIQGNTYEGLTEEGITIRMYLNNDDKIISAFPQYEGR